ncbi:putative Trichoplein keratin filament-binding protein [Hypsibius exemplaris]|uniref:Trichoplein keratin filament-binding protein n=1 Tax=Hypsibius exemplaris TaxID=2072580 RepID=A0A1W0WH10_HYPEX|nr:putative Trichoplein keratin filament-binding protein [Hypsibius exemplaris]
MRTASGCRSSPGTLRAQQELLQQRRAIEENRRDGWKQHYADSRKAACNAQQYQKLSSEKTFQNSIDSYMRRQIEKRKSTDILRRRTELAVLLHEEESHCQAELMEKVQDSKSNRMKEIRDRVELLRQARVRQQEQIVSQKLQDVWKRDSHELREAKSKQIDMETAKAWGDQISIRKQSEEEERMIEGQLVQNMQREVHLAAERDDLKQKEEREKMKDLAEVWQDQCASLKRHDEQMRLLQQQERECLLQLSKLNDMEEQRKKLEDLETRKELGRNLMTQHAAHIRRRNRQVQEGLEFDRQLLEKVHQIEQESVRQQNLQKERARTSAAHMKESMEDRLRIEKQRENEIDRLDKEEAKLYWQKRDLEWRTEEDARRHLVNEVIGDLREQLKEKVQANRQAQREIEQGKEEVVAMMRLSEMEKQKQLDNIASSQTHRRTELDAQMRELELKQQREKQGESEDRRREESDQRNYDDFLARETAKLGEGGRSQSGAIN